tara:strand:- start:61195 stop:61386 length:192 start_codon:yes stop_codon:yes gene_type:complete
MIEPLSSKRLQVINDQMSDIYADVDSLSEALVDKEPIEALDLISSIRIKLNILKSQITNGDIV